MYDAKKDENVPKKQLQYECIGDRSYFCMCTHNNMIDMKVSSAPIEIETVSKAFE